MGIQNKIQMFENISGDSKPQKCWSTNNLLDIEQTWAPASPVQPEPQNPVGFFIPDLEPVGLSDMDFDSPSASSSWSVVLHISSGASSCSSIPVHYQPTSDVDSLPGK